MHNIEDQSLNPIVVFKSAFMTEYQRLMQDEQPRKAAPVEETVETIPIDPARLSANFDATMAVLDDMFKNATKHIRSGFQLDSMEVNLEVSAEGQLGFLGSSVKAAGKSSFKLLFKRQTDGVASIGSKASLMESGAPRATGDELQDALKGMALYQTSSMPQR